VKVGPCLTVVSYGGAADPVRPFEYRHEGNPDICGAKLRSHIADFSAWQKCSLRFRIIRDPIVLGKTHTARQMIRFAKWRKPDDVAASGQVASWLVLGAPSKKSPLPKCRPCIDEASAGPGMGATLRFV